MRHEPDARRRKHAHRFGHRAETLALLWLALKGYRPLALRYTVRGGEVDLIVKRGHVIAFVEVKARASRDEAVAAVGSAKVRRVERAAAVWLSRNPWARSFSLRGDMVAVEPWRRPLHLPGGMPFRIGG